MLSIITNTSFECILIITSFAMIFGFLRYAVTLFDSNHIIHYEIIKDSLEALLYILFYTIAILSCAFVFSAILNYIII